MKRVKKFFDQSICKTVSFMITGAAVVPLALPTLCAQTVSAQDADDYTVKAIPVYRESMDEQETVDLRFYTDEPHVAYMGIRDYYHRFLFGEMNITENEDGVYTLSGAEGDTAVINVEKDTLKADDFFRFNALPVVKESGFEGATAETAPYVLREEEEYAAQITPTEISFGRYSIDLRADDEDIYFPLATLSDLFETGEICYVVYNGEKIYAQDLSGHFYSDSALGLDDSYHDPLVNGEKRPEDLADFNYRELCFNIDTFYGFPGSAVLNDAVADKGLDQALEEQDPDTKHLLLSQDQAEYIVGLNRLLNCDLGDKGHTGFDEYLTFLFEEDAFSLKVQNLSEEYRMEDSKEYGEKKAAGKALLAEKDRVFGEDRGSCFFITEGDTAMFSMDSFECDMDAWNAYYENGGELPAETDSFAAVYEALKKAEEDPKIRNFVLDLSTNGGGTVQSMVGILGLLTGKGEMYIMNRLSGMKQHISFLSDRNLDHRFDEADQKGSDLNIAVLISRYSFSCGNYLPVLIKEQGVLLMGDRSGGGTCFVQENSTADGWRYAISISETMADAGWNPIDDGIAADISLFTTKNDGTRDYSGFYDLQAISKYMHEYYND